MMPTHALLPGVYFRTEPPVPEGVLPRMDIAAFVGFAASGPVGVPVVVEELDRFRELFGADPALAWDRRAGRIHHGHLGPTVEAFFRNGGRRCWIVRVAEAPHRHQFTLPALHEAEGLDHALAEARSPGSWADGLRVGTILERRPLRLAGVGATGLALGDYALELAVEPSQLAAGDLLELQWPEAELHLFLFLDSAEPIAGATESGIALARGTRGYWFERPAPSTSSPASPPVSPPPSSSDLGEERLVDGALGEAAGLALAAALGASSPAVAPTVHRLSFEIRVWRAEAGLVAASADGEGEGLELVSRMAGLAFHPAHPRYWARLPTDATLFRLPHGRLDLPRPPAVRALLDAAASPRFPLAGDSAIDLDEPATAPAFLPLDMAFEASPATASAPLDPLTETALERDGLAEFSHRLFLDPALAWASGTALLQEAEHRYYQRQLPLAGLHSLLPVDEPTLIAVPDASHPGWSRELPELPAPLGAPVLLSIGEPVEGFVEVTWTPVDEATGYLLEVSTAPDFSTDREVFTSATTSFQVPLGEPCPRRLYFRVRAARESLLGPWSNTRRAVLPPTPFAPCEERLLPGLVLAFAPGSPGPEGLLLWEVDPALPGSGPDPAALDSFDVEIEASTVAGFEAVETSATLPALPAEAAIETSALLYYRLRVRAADGSFGPWSNTVAVLPSGLGDWTLLEPGESADELLAVQRALLRFCAARRDLLALLTVPAHFRQDELRDHLRRLAPGDVEPASATSSAVRPLRLSEAETLAFGALYHPWVIAFPEQRAREAATLALDLAPPTGTVAGSMARLALTDGAWIAPANVELDGVLALVPELDRALWPALLERQVNLLVQEPRGFFCWNAETLSREQDVRPISVRRLLILLRRLALREGSGYVFEPNDRHLRGLVRHRFERVLSDLFVRGALAGSTADEAFRVVVDESVNTPRTIERGQFLVELRVAPSRPMKFLHIRLVQDGPEQLAVQEI